MTEHLDDISHFIVAKLLACHHIEIIVGTVCVSICFCGQILHAHRIQRIPVTLLRIRQLIVYIIILVHIPR